MRWERMSKPGGWTDVSEAAGQVEILRQEPLDSEVSHTQLVQKFNYLNQIIQITDSGLYKFP